VFSYSQGRLTGTQIPVPANDLAVADFNGDHHPDLLASTTQSGETMAVPPTCDCRRAWAPSAPIRCIKI
jgi:hypothetical protein